MVEADLYCFLGLVYSALVCLCSMSMFWWLDVIPGWEWLAEVLVIFWIGVSVSIIAWMKIWMAKPTFNTGSHSYHICLIFVHAHELNYLACSMMVIILFIV